MKHFNCYYQYLKMNWATKDLKGQIFTIFLICVKKEYRRKGVGQKLLSVLLKFAKNSDLKTIYCTTMYEFKAARELYKKNNFIEIKEMPKDLAMPDEDIYLELNL